MGRKAPTAECKLCQKVAKLSYSHILPEFLFDGVYDDKHRAIISDSTKRQPIQKPWREYLLCSGCEGQFSRYEVYANRKLYQFPQFSRATRLGKAVRVYTDLDYDLLKLFQLSLIWRAGVATGEAFKAVQLGPHQERLRTMLEAEDPGDPFDCPCFLIYSPSFEQLLQSTAIAPLPLRIDGAKSYQLAAGRFFWIFVVASHGPDGRLDPFILKDGQPFIVMESDAPFAEDRDKILSGFFLDT